MDKIKSVDKVKRERSVNFTLEEQTILVSLVFKYKDIIENKQSDATTWKKKENAWETIQNEFNARSGGAPRTSKTLRIKYEGLKRSVRKKSAVIRSELYRTGGGSNDAVPLDSTEERIKSLITLSTDGLESIFDSDVLPQTQESQGDLGNASMEEFIVIPADFPKMESSFMDSKRDSHSDDVEMQAPSETVEVEDNMDNVNGIYEDTTTPIKKTKLTPSSLKWDVTCRRNLKTKRHPALVANIQKKTDELTKAKLELIQLQKELVKKEMAEKVEESKFKEKQRQWIEEEYMLKLQILRKQLNE